MTCVVALEKDGVIWMGADSAAFRNDEINIRTDPKVFKVDNFLFGFSGSFRVGQLIRYAFRPPKNTRQRSDMEYMVVDFVDSLKLLLEEKGVLLKDGTGDSHDSEIVVGFHKKIYVIESDFNVSIRNENYAVSGSGAAYALGALYILNLNQSMGPEEKIELALRASVEYCPSVRLPFVIMSDN